MDGLSWSVIVAAAGVALIHTALGPDHYLPFVMLARARRWGAGKTALVTAVCGIGHVASSLVLAGIGVALGVAAGRLERFESGRAGWAGWALVAFGLAYGVWGARKAFRRSTGLTPHAHGGHVHLHLGGAAPHRHRRAAAGSRFTFWALFAVFVLGPCEPLIPLFVLPVSREAWGLAAAAAAVFGVATVGTMVGLTLLALGGLRLLPLAPCARWDHVLAGGFIAASGLAVLFLGL